MSIPTILATGVVASVEDITIVDLISTCTNIISRQEYSSPKVKEKRSNVA